MSAREELHSLIQETKQYIKNNHEYLTAASIEAVEEMVFKAEKALSGEEVLPFTRSREFYAPRTDEAVRFALERYTMCPTYLLEGKVWGVYGLKEALRWLKTRNFSQWSPEELEKAKAHLWSQKAVLDTLPRGTAPGEMPTGAGEPLCKAETEISGAPDSLSLAKALVKGYDVLRQYRHAQVLRNDQHACTRGGIPNHSGTCRQADAGAGRCTFAFNEKRN